jgi:hypothetical protein
MTDLRQTIANLTKTPNGIQDLPPHVFEHVIGELFAGNGYRVQITPPTRDGGYDILAVYRAPLGIEFTTVIECKRYAPTNKVGVAPLRSLYGVKSFLGVPSAVFVTTSSFTTDARHFAETKHDIELVDGLRVAEWLKTYVQPPTEPYLAASRFSSCFISHSHQDHQFATRLNHALRAAGIKVWFAPEDMLPGKKVYEQIKDAIKGFDRLLLVLSEHSMSSDWVITEIRAARKKEREEKRQVLFPISLVPFDRIQRWECFDSDTGKDLATEVREYFIPDFTRWADNASFNAQLQLLLRGLAESEQSQLARARASVSDIEKQVLREVDRITGRAGLTTEWANYIHDRTLVVYVRADHSMPDGVRSELAAVASRAGLELSVHDGLIDDPGQVV